MRSSSSSPFVPARLAIGLLAVSLVAFGCTSGGASPAASQAPAASSGASAGPTAAPAGSAASSVQPGGAALNTAVVTIGSDRYEFTDLRCDILTTKYIQAGNYGGDPEVTIVLPPDGWEAQGDVFSPPSVTVKIDGGAEWVAGDEGWFGDTYPEGKSQIDSYTVPDGRPVTATGTATFSDQAAILFGRPTEPMTGTFEVTCP